MFIRKIKFSLLAFFLIPTLSGISPVNAKETTREDSPASVFANARKLPDTEQQEGLRFGMGYAFFGNFLNDTEIGSMSIALDVDSTHFIQVYSGIGTLKDYFNFGAGVLYRATLTGDRLLGLHVGALAQVGIQGEESFSAQIGPTIGIHSAVFQFQRLQLSLDGGPMARYHKRPDFSTGLLGNGILGLSIHYFL